MDRKKVDIAIGRCGIVCELCKNFNIGCRGCDEENISRNSCLIFKCAVKKEVAYCIQCPEYPCNLMRSLSKSYCPVFTKFKIE